MVQLEIADAHPDGAIAQLGERLICIQEVVGSIPSGSTIGYPGKEVRVVSHGMAWMFDIVKREHIWLAGHFRRALRTSAGLRPVRPGVFGKQCLRARA
jgi:hypothetical protein